MLGELSLFRHTYVHARLDSKLKPPPRLSVSVSVVLVMTFANVNFQIRRCHVKALSKLTEVEIVVLCVADGKDEAEHVDDGWQHNVSKRTAEGE